MDQQAAPPAQEDEARSPDATPEPASPLATASIATVSSTYELDRLAILVDRAAAIRNPPKKTLDIYRERFPLGSMNKDGCYTQVHMHEARLADLFEDFCKDRLPNDNIFVPAHHQPINPEDEDGVVPDQHAAFGIQNATQRACEPAWRDLNLPSLMRPQRGQLQGQRSNLPR